MESLRKLEMNVLVDMLAIQTDKYLEMQNGGATETEFAKCNLAIKALQKEIDLRKKESINISPNDLKIIHSKE